MRYHFSGIAGAGMNPLAQLMVSWGHQVQGSDRSIDQGCNADIAARLQALGVTIVPQDGAGVSAALDRFVYSAAVEAETPEMVAARNAKLVSMARPGLLAEVVNQAKPGVAIAGTSGKSTVTALIAWILRQANIPHTLLGGAAVVGEGTAGGFHAGPQGAAVVAEACESDGTLPGYKPTFGLVHNITRDHAELSSLRAQFIAFASGCGTLIVNADCSEANQLTAAKRLSYGVDHPCDAPYEIIAIGPERSMGVIRLPGDIEVTMDCAQPGRHSVQNAAAAACVTFAMGVDPQIIAQGIQSFPGISRRFEVVGRTDTGIRVVDDYAHNADKIRAAITAAQAGCERLVAVFFPHGFAPARFLRPELADMLPTILRPQDRFAYGPIFYAGGTVAQDISSEILGQDIQCPGFTSKEAIQAWICETAFTGDTVLIMGARDPDLHRFAKMTFGLL